MEERRLGKRLLLTNYWAAAAATCLCEETTEVQLDKGKHYKQSEIK